jgi:pyruvate ferredoxin oxidoreductase gamma subunit
MTEALFIRGQLYAGRRPAMWKTRNTSRTRHRWTAQRAGLPSAGMFEIRIHGRGGQGVVTAAELLAAAAFTEGRHSQAFPSFGSERTGAPVVSFCRLDDRPIRLREPIVSPDAVIVIDPTLLHQVDLFAGLKTDGFVLINSSRELSALGLKDLEASSPSGRLRTVPATELAREHLGRPLPNAALLGGFAALTRVVSIASVADAIHDRFGGRLGDGNAAAARATFVRVAGTAGLLEAAHA